MNEKITARRLLPVIASVVLGNYVANKTHDSVRWLIGILLLILAGGVAWNFFFKSSKKK